MKQQLLTIKSRTEFAKTEHVAYLKALHNSWLDDFFPETAEPIIKIKLANRKPLLAVMRLCGFRNRMSKIIFKINDVPVCVLLRWETLELKEDFLRGQSDDNKITEITGTHRCI